jgi:hypothetical protein
MKGEQEEKSAGRVSSELAALPSVSLPSGEI